MKTIRDYLYHPAMLALIDYSDNDSKAVLHWPDGGEILVQLDTFLPSDESEDGSEECVIKTLKVLRTAKSVEDFKEGESWIVSTNSPPSVIMSPNRSKVWNAPESR